MVVKSLTSLEIEITDMMRRQQHITKLQSELIQEKKIDWSQTRWSYSEALLPWKIEIWDISTSCYTQHSISYEIQKTW